MADALERALAAVRGHPGLAALRRGIEKECLRTTTAGELARTAHPPALGSPLTHPHITTDFSEAQLELITGIHGSAEGALTELADVQRFVAANIDSELLWAASMPCHLGADEGIPIARFGTANAGRCKTIYRLGLSHRYGRRMQAISGIHYNFSLPEQLWPAIAASRGEAAGQDFATRAYFGLIRNFRRYSWLLIYLFGAAPAAARSFAPDAELPRLDAETLFVPEGTSLRMGRLGYQSAAQAALHISYNSLAEYAATMRRALTTPYPAYAAIGVAGGTAGEQEEYRQLSTALLQIENEFYGTIRPKRRASSGERPLQALGDRGVEYVEVRCLDLDPFLPLGIDAVGCRFLDVFLLFCLLADSPPDSEAESAALAANQLAVVSQGRDPDLEHAFSTKFILEFAAQLNFERISARPRNLAAYALTAFITFFVCCNYYNFLYQTAVQHISRHNEANALDEIARLHDEGNYIQISDISWGYTYELTVYFHGYLPWFYGREYNVRSEPPQEAGLPHYIVRHFNTVSRLPETEQNYRPLAYARRIADLLQAGSAHIALDGGAGIALWQIYDNEFNRIWWNGDALDIPQLVAEAGDPIIRSDFDVYLNDRRLIYINDKCDAADLDNTFFLAAFPINDADLPEKRRPHGFDNLDFTFANYGFGGGERCFAVRYLPTYPVKRIHTGQYINTEDGSHNTWEGEAVLSAE